MKLLKEIHYKMQEVLLLLAEEIPCHHLNLLAKRYESYP